MSLLSKLVFLLCLIGVYGSSYAAVERDDFSVCGVFSDAEDGKGDKKDGDKQEEEPDCE